MKYVSVVKVNDEYKTTLVIQEESYEDAIAQLNVQLTNEENKISKLEDDIALYSDAHYGIKAHGRLKVGEKGLLDQNDIPFQLKGMSTHGISWYPKFTNVGALNTLKKYGANVVRLVVYSEQPGSYQYSSKENMNYLYTAIENALAINMYVIVDWHVLREEDPNVTKAYAKEFFEDLSSHYGNHEGIIYEICNEPNGENTSWEDVCIYADEIIPLIRKNAPDSIIIVGTPDFCTDIEEAANNPLAYENILYSMHVYFDLSKEDAENKTVNRYADKFNLGIPVIVSEWGMKNTDGKIYKDTVEDFLDVMAYNNISWCNWSLSNKNESYSFIKKDCNKLSGWEDEDLTVSGKIIKEALKN